MRIYGDTRSGNCYKLQLLLSLLGKTCEWIDVDIMKGETRAPSFLEKTPNGKIPLLELDDGRVLSESNAIMHYLASNTPLIPSSPYSFSQLLQWQFFEQYSHEPYIAVARYINVYLGLPEDRKAEYESKQAGGYRAGSSRSRPRGDRAAGRGHPADGRMDAASVRRRSCILACPIGEFSVP